MQRASYGNYNGVAPLKVFAGAQEKSRQCEVDALSQRVDMMEMQMAKDNPLQCSRCPSSDIDCSKASNSGHCTDLQRQCQKNGCYDK